MERPEAFLDISLPIGPGMPVYPGDDPVVVEPAATFEDGPSRTSRLVLNSHTGTHVDAPAHFLPGGETLSEVGLDRLNGPAWVLEVPRAAAIEVAHLEAVWPAAAAPERVLFKTPNSELWGTADAGKVWQALSPDAATWLVERGVRLVGIDALSIEAYGVETFPVHHTLLGAGVLILEGLDFRAVAPGPYWLYCLPLRLTNPDGAPARALLAPLA